MEILTFRFLLTYKEYIKSFQNKGYLAVMFESSYIRCLHTKKHYIFT